MKSLIVNLAMRLLKVINLAVRSQAWMKKKVLKKWKMTRMSL